MKRYITNILIFFAIVAVIDLGLGYVGDYLQAHAKGGDTKKLNDLVMNNSHDIIIFGSSRAHHHYDTPFLSDTLGMDVYNAGYDGNGVVLAYGLLDMILQRYKPQLILFDVEPCFDILVYKADNNHKRYITFLKPYYDRMNVGEVIKDVSYEEWCKVHSGMLRYNSQIITIAVDNLRSQLTLGRGYEPLTGVYKGEPYADNEIKTVDTFKLYYIKKLIYLAQKKGVPIMLVASPKYSTHNSDYLQPIRKICVETNTPFIDYYSDTVFLQHKEWFKEPMHLNSNGAREFSARIVNEILMNINNCN